MFRLARNTLLSTGRRHLTTNTAPPVAARRVSLPLTLVLATALSVPAFIVGYTYPPPIVSMLYPQPANAPPPADSPEGRAEVLRIESAIQALPLSALHRSKADEYYEARPYVHYPPEKRINSLTAGALRGAGKLGVPPLVFGKKDESEAVVIIHVGRGVCGHEGIVHGGVIATLLDETLARNAMQNLPNKIAVTANLTVDYRAPTKADQFIVIRTRLESVKGRKAVVTGRVETLEGELLAESKGIFVEPKYAKLLNREVINQAMGQPELLPSPTST